MQGFRVYRGSAEALSRESNLDISVHVEHLDKPFEAVEAALGAAEACLNHCVSLNRFSHVTLKELERSCERPGNANHK